MAKTRLRPTRKSARPKESDDHTRPKPLSWLADWLFIAFIFGTVFLSFVPALKGQFLGWDDAGNFLENFDYRGLSWPHVRWMFTTFYYGHYSPLTWLTLGLDYTLWGMKPMGYHVTNLLLHAFNAVVFYYLVRELLQKAPAFSSRSNTWSFSLAATVGALFFAIHPLRVEPVAWITERRDVLSGFFYLLTILSYLIMTEKCGSQRNKWLLLSLMLFVASLLSKAWAITLPLVLFILDIYPLRRVGAGKQLPASCSHLLREKIPFILIASLFAVLAALAQQKWSIRPENHTLPDRMMQAAFGLCFYPWKTLLPIRLSPLYLLEPTFHAAQPRYAICALVALGLTLALVKLRHKLPWALTAWACYGVVVSPVLGLAQSGEQIAADRYTYLSCLPFAILVASGFLKLWLLRREGRLPLWKWISILAILLAGLCGLSLLTFQQSHIWLNEYSLWNHALKLDPANFVACNSRGHARMESGDLEGAMADFNRAIQLNSKRHEPYHNRGVIRYQQNDFAGALADYKTAIQLRPKAYRTYNNRGAVYEVQGDLRAAVKEYTVAVTLQPKYSVAYYNRGNVRLRQEDISGALADFTSAVSVNPTYADAYYKRGELRGQRGDPQGAVEDLARSLKVASLKWSFRSQAERLLADYHMKVKEGNPASR